MTERKTKNQPTKKNCRENKKLGYYAQALNEAEQLELELAAGVDGIDDEIALLRVKFKSALADDNADIRLIMQAATVLARLLSTRYRITRDQKKGLKDAISNVIRDVAVPLGISAIRQP